MAPYLEWTLEESPAGTGLRRFVGHGRERPAQAGTAEAYESYEPPLHAPRRWGLSAEAVAHLGDRLYQFWLRFRGGCTTRTRDPSAAAYAYLRAQLTMDTERNFANMDRTRPGGEGQALQHFMSNSPWSGPVVFSQMQAAIKAIPALAHGSPLMRDESADEKAGTHNAGASRQSNGRLGKGDVCRGSTRACPRPMAGCGRWWRAPCSCQQSGGGQPLPRGAQSWVARPSAAVRRRSSGA